MTLAGEYVTYKISDVQEGVIILRMWARYSNPLAEYTQALIIHIRTQGEGVALLGASGATSSS